jgi:PhnB protein
MTTAGAVAQKSTPVTSLTGVIAYVQVRDARAAAELYVRAFGAKVISQMPMGGKIIHCHLEINGGPLFLNDPFPEQGHPLETPQSFSLTLPVDSADAWWQRAVDAGCEGTTPVRLEFWGDRYGVVRDPFGITWSLVSPGGKT